MAEKIRKRWRVYESYQENSDACSSKLSMLSAQIKNEKSALYCYPHELMSSIDRIEKEFHCIIGPNFEHIMEYLNSGEKPHMVQLAWQH